MENNTEVEVKKRTKEELDKEYTLRCTQIGDWRFKIEILENKICEYLKEMSLIETEARALEIKP